MMPIRMYSASVVNENYEASGRQRHDYNWRNRIYQSSRGLRCLKVENFDLIINGFQNSPMRNNRMQGDC
jgi:hypothetical protein